MRAHLYVGNRKVGELEMEDDRGIDGKTPLGANDALTVVLVREDPQEPKLLLFGRLEPFGHGAVF